MSQTCAHVNAKTVGWSASLNVNRSCSDCGASWYENHCWCCKMIIDSRQGIHRCPECGWYSCPHCGNCAPTCGQSTDPGEPDEISGLTETEAMNAEAFNGDYGAFLDWFENHD